MRRVKRTRSEETNRENFAIWNMPMDMHKNVSVQVDSDFALLLPSGVYEIKKMEPRSKIRTIIVFCLFLAIAGIIGFGYFCQDQVCDKRDYIIDKLIIDRYLFAIITSKRQRFTQIHKFFFFFLFYSLFTVSLLPRCLAPMQISC